MTSKHRPPPLAAVIAQYAKTKLKRHRAKRSKRRYPSSKQRRRNS